MPAENGNFCTKFYMSQVLVYDEYVHYGIHMCHVASCISTNF